MSGEYIDNGGSIMKITFTVAIIKEENWHVAKCVENNVASQGKSIDDAIKNLKEALELYYENEQWPHFSQTYMMLKEVHCKQY